MNNARSTKSKKLTPESGDRNQCPTCGQMFNSTAAFDAHRTFEDGRPGDWRFRRCMDIDEMIEAGMGVNTDGFWVVEAWDGQRIDRREVEVELC